ncbi:MAG: DUF934 domain-containing protein [Pseudomonadota bacterium]
MPHLISNTTGDWQLLADAEAVAWQSSADWQPGQPLCLDGDEEPQENYVEASRIAINFAAFNDGRGLSLAVLLRQRLNFTGELRAVGAVHEDILHYMVRCGFSSFELPDERDADIALASLKPYTDTYQGSVVQPEPAFRRTHRG